jgi:hypothetical protein
MLITKTKKMNLKSFIRFFLPLFVTFLFTSTGVFSQMLRCEVFQSLELHVKEDSANSKDYVVTMAGEKIYYESYSWKYGPLTKDRFDVDGRRFKLKDIRGYMDDGEFSHRIGRDFITRRVHGLINIYCSEEVLFISRQSQTIPNSTNNRTEARCFYYAQKGDIGEIVQLKTFNDIEKLVSDCPEVLRMIQGKNHVKELRENKNYIIDVIKQYNSNCK